MKKEDAHLCRRWIGYCLLLGVLGAPLFAHAALVTLDFDDQTPGSYFGNMVVDGARFSPSCHMDIVAPSDGAWLSGYDDTSWAGFDRSGCLGGDWNDAYLGGAVSETDALLWMDLGGAAFDLTELYLVDPHIQIESSKGGLFHADLSDGPGMVAFSGAEWTGINGLRFRFPSDPGVPGGIDHITLNRVPEPGVIWLVGLGLLALAWSAARRRCRPR